MKNKEDQMVTVSTLPDEKQKRGAKGFTFFSGIFDILIGVVLFACLVWVAVFLFPDWTAGNNGLNALWAIFVFPFVVSYIAVMAVGGILFLIFGIMSVVASFQHDRRFNKGLVISTMVFDILIGILALLGLLISLDSGGSSSVFIFVGLVFLSLVGLIFKIVDLVLISHRNKQYVAQHPVEMKTEGNINFDALSEFNKETKENEK